MVLRASRAARSCLRAACLAFVSACSRLALAISWAHKGEQAHCMGRDGVNKTSQLLDLQRLAFILSPDPLPARWPLDCAKPR